MQEKNESRGEAAVHSPRLLGLGLENLAAILPILVLAFLIPFGSVSFTIAFPVISKQLGLGPIHSAWMSAAYLIAGAVAAMPAGRAADRIGRKKALLAGLLAFTLGCAVVSAGAWFWLLLPGFFAMGLGAGAATVVGTSIIYDRCSKAQQERVYGVLISCVSAGILGGNFVGGAVIHYGSWRWIFGASALLAALLFAFVFRKSPPDAGKTTGRGLDLAGTAFYGVFIFCFFWGFSRVPSSQSLVFIPAALAVLAVFAWREHRHPHPVCRVDLFRANPMFRFAAVISAVKQYTLYGVMFLMSFYLQHVCELTPAAAGLILGAGALTTTAVSPFSERIARRIGDFTMVALGVLLNTAALVLLCLQHDALNLLLAVVPLVMLGAASGLLSAPAAGIMFRSVSKEEHAMAAATLDLSRRFGDSVSVGIIMMVCALLLGSASLASIPSADFVAFLRAVLIVFAGMSLAALIYASAAARAARRRRQA
jgi:MFS family permease